MKVAGSAAEICALFPEDAAAKEIYQNVRAAWFARAKNFRDSHDWDAAEKEYKLMNMCFFEDIELGREIRRTSAERLAWIARSLLERGALKDALEKVSEAVVEAEGIDEIEAEVADLAGKINSTIDAKVKAFLDEAEKKFKAAARKRDMNGIRASREFVVKARDLRETPRALALLKEIDDRQYTPPGMTYVPAGECVIGDSDQDFWPYESPTHKMTLKAYYMDIQPVTNVQYKKFLDKHRARRKPVLWINGKIPMGLGNHPVVGVTLADAQAYAQWVGKRLPTEEEWERAARGINGLKYPWGNKYKTRKKKTTRGTYPVGVFPEGESQCACLDMAGNVWEWTSTRLYLYPGSTAEIEPEDKGKYVTRGGYSTDDEDFRRCSYRWPRKADASEPSLGFRCAKDVTR